ncbi:MAG: ABC transporter six-transmembrane domain-containing protein [Pseudomonadota bacterium]
MLLDRRLSLRSIAKIYWRKIFITWSLTLFETILLVALPLLIGRSIDGLLNRDRTAFLTLIGAMGVLLIVGVARRAYDTRAYGSMRVALGEAVVGQARERPLSSITARLDMSRELIDFLEIEAPVVLTACVQVIAAIAILFSFHSILAVSAGGAGLLALVVYSVSSSRFFKLNQGLNEQTEKQVSVLINSKEDHIRDHLLSLRRFEVRLSDTEAIVYGLIFAVLLTMLGGNLWFAATQINASPGQVFSIVTYSYEFIESAVTLPAALQSLTRISEITNRINIPGQKP